MTNSDFFRDECSNCAALCCVALSFDKSNLFGFDKAAGTPCLNLDKKGRCRIHDDKKKLGFSGCLHYSCLGAGQRVSQECFKGQVWQDNPALLPAMLEAFAQGRKVHELLSLLHESQKLALNRTQQDQANKLVLRLTPQKSMSKVWLASVSAQNLEKEVHDFLKSLRALVNRKK